MPTVPTDTGYANLAPVSQYHSGSPKICSEHIDHMHKVNTEVSPECIVRFLDPPHLAIFNGKHIRAFGDAVEMGGIRGLGSVNQRYG